MVFLILFLMAGGGGNLLDEALGKVGFNRENLGYSPKGYWNRYPLPGLIPHKLSFFDDFMREPIKIYDFAKTMAYAGEKFLPPEYLNSNLDALYQIVYFLGVDRKITGFRNYSSNISPRVDKETPLEDALIRLFEIASSQMNFFSFGARYDYLFYLEDIQDFVKPIPKKLKIPLAKLILNILDAYKFWLISMRNVALDDILRVFYVRDFPETQSDGSKYYPEFDDIAMDLDEHSLYYASLKAVNAALEALMEMDRAMESLVKSDYFSIEWETIYTKLNPIRRFMTGEIITRTLR